MSAAGLSRPAEAEDVRALPLRALLKRAAEAPGPPVPCAVVHPCDDQSLGGAMAAMERGFIAPILVGPEDRIRAVAARLGIEPARLPPIEPVPHSHAAAERAVALCREGRAEALMKGSLKTEELLHAVVAREGGLRTERRLSHVYVLAVPGHAKLLFVTDAAVNILPDLETKADIVRNAIDLCHTLGIERPKVALLSAVEVVTSRLPATLHAASLCKMAERGQIEGGILEGPLAFDAAVSLKAAQAKHLGGEVVGDADILVVPDLEAGNMLAKQLEYLSDAEVSGIAVGARVPIALTSRADGPGPRLVAAALVRLAAGAMRLGKHGADHADA